MWLACTRFNRMVLINLCTEFIRQQVVFRGIYAAIII